MSTPSVPEQVGRYRVLRPLGSGAMGDVFLALDPHIDRELAVKTVRVLGGSEADIAERKQRLLREAKAAGKMMHPHIVTLFDADEIDGLLYLAFEYVPGMDLAQRMGASPTLTLGQALTIVRQVASALDYAHSQRIVHRDIKPSNILIGPSGEAKVADFGIAKMLGLTDMTRTGSVVGSPQYMSPEQVRGEGLDGRSDVFSLGVVLYELLCRSRPFGGDTLSTLIFEILSKEPPSVDRLRPGLPPALTRLVDRMMAKDRAQRSASARAVLNELDGLWSTLDPSLLQTPLESRLAGQSSSASSTVSGVAPTATFEEAPTIDSGSAQSLPPLPPIPTATATPSSLGSPPPPPSAGPLGARVRQGGQAAQPAIPSPPSVHDGSSAGRPSPLDTGTYSGAGRGKVLGLAVALILAVAAAAVGIGFLVARMGPDDGASASGEQEQAASGVTDSSNDGVEDRPVEDPQPAESEAVSSRPAPEDVVGEAAGSEAGDPDSGPSSHTTVASEVDSAPEDPEPVRVSQVETSSGATGADRPPARDRAPPARRDPPAPTRDTEPAPIPEPGTPTTPDPVAPPQAEEPAATGATPRELEFDRLAATAAQELTTGLRLFFDIKPKDTIVKIQARGERSIVQGQAENFEPGKDGRPLELAGSGQYLVTLLHSSHPDLVMKINADAGRGNPHTVRLDMATASRAARRDAASGPQVIRVSRGLSFDVRPRDAEVWLDGEKIGRAADWPGGRLPRSRQNLQLKQGSHTLRLQAEGYQPLEIKVEVGTSRKRIHRIDYHLRRQP